MAIHETVSGQDSIAITGEATGPGSLGVLGKGDAVGVRGESVNWHAVVGLNTGSQGFGVYGHSAASGVVGESDTWMGVYGKSASTTGGAGVMGEAIGPGVIGTSQTWMGVYGETKSTTGGSGVWGEHKADGTGVTGKSGGGVGVWGISETNEGVHAETNSPVRAAVSAISHAPNGTGAAVYAEKQGSIGHAGYFVGNVHITQSLSVEGDVMLQNADCAEEFSVQGLDESAPGTVLVIDGDGCAVPCETAYDSRVLGVVSGAGGFKPAIVLDRQGGSNRRAVALMGKVFCLVDASFGRS